MRGLAFLLVAVLQGTGAIGRCREDNVCQHAPPPFPPLKPSVECDCWSTCNCYSTKRKCDNVNSGWGLASKGIVKHSTDGCSWIPFCTNQRDMCVYTVKKDEAQPEAAQDGIQTTTVIVLTNEAQPEAEDKLGGSAATPRPAAAVATSNKCTSDIAKAAISVGKAGVNIAEAVSDCKSNATQCAEDISEAVANLGQASTDITDAVQDCGGSNNTHCARDLTGLATSLGKAGAEVSRAVNDCRKPGKLKCDEDVAAAAVNVGLITADIIKATKDCKPSLSGSPKSSKMSVRQDAVIV